MSRARSRSITGSNPSSPLFEQFNQIEEQARSAVVHSIQPQQVTRSQSAGPHPILSASSEQKQSSEQPFVSSDSISLSASVDPSNHLKKPKMAHMFVPPFDSFKNKSDQDIENWLDTYESWCDVQDGMTDEKKVKTLLVYLGTEELKDYYRSLKLAATDARPFNWVNVKADFIKRYRIEKKTQVLYDKLINLEHKYEDGETVSEFTKKFITIANRIKPKDLPEENKVRTYLAHLDPRIKSKLLHLTDKTDITLTQAEAEAKRIEEGNQEVEEANRLVRKRNSKHAAATDTDTDTTDVSESKTNSNSSNSNGIRPKQSHWKFGNRRYGSNRYHSDSGSWRNGRNNESSSQDARRLYGGRDNLNDIVCFNCGERGHFANHCPRPRNTNRATQSVSSPSVPTIATPSRQSHSHHAIIVADDNTGSNQDELTAKYFVDAELNGIDKVKAQVDCGAMVSVITRTYYETLRYKPVVTSSGMKLHAVDGRPLEQSGMIQVLMAIHGHIIPRPVRLILIEESAPDTTVILGNDFARKHLVSNDTIKKIMQLKYSNEVIPLIEEILDDSIGVYVLVKEVIPPQSVVQMRVRLDERKLPELVNESKDNSILFEPSGVNGVTMPAALVNAAGDRESVTLTVNNLSNEQVTIDNNTRLGTLVPVEVVSAAEVIDQNNTQPAYMDADSEEVEDKSNSTNTLEIAVGVNISLDDTVVMSVTEKKALISVLKKHAAAFANHPKRVGITDLVQHQINTGNNPPIHIPPYRLGPHIDGKIQEMVRDMIEDSVIIDSASPWSSPVLLVKKKDGSMRFCVDFRRLNAITKKDVYPMRRIDSTLDALGKAYFLSSLDMQSGYWQLALDPRDAEKTAFSTSRGHYQFVVMPFGLTNAPATFQRLMDNILRDFHSFCLVYIDDIIIFSNTFEEHLIHLSKVLQRLIDSHLVVKPSKCQLLKQELPFLGHVITPGYIAPDPEKIAAVSTFPVPHNVKSLQSFLGLVNYYRRFVQGLSDIAEPLYRLLKKGIIWQWTDIHQRAFEALKLALTSDPLMGLPDFDRPFVLHTDANNTGLGAVLSQVIDGIEHPIYYASKTLNPAQRNYHTTEKECLAVKWACQLFRPYLIGRHFVVYTDHNALRWLFQHKDPNSKLTRMILSLQEFSFDIVHRPGPQNANADALSRIPDLIENQNDNVNSSVQVSAITRATGNREGRRPVYRPQSDVYFHQENYDLDAALAASAAMNQPISDNNENRSDDNKDSGHGNATSSDGTVVPYALPLQGGRDDQDDEDEEKYNDNNDQPEPAAMSSADEPIGLNMSRLAIEQRNDPQLIPILAYLERGSLRGLPHNSIEADRVKRDSSYYKVLHGLLHRIWRPNSDRPQLDAADYRPVIPMSLRPAILRSFHDSSIAGHLGEMKTYERIRSKYYWQGMHKDVEAWVKTCPQCSGRKLLPSPGRLPLGQLPIPTAAFQCLGIDVLGPLPVTTKGNRYLLCITDYYTRYPIALPMSNQRAITIAKLLVEEVFLVYGFPSSLLSDRGTNFLSELISSMLELFRIRKLSTTSYHPQTNGLTERFNSTLEAMLSHFITKNQNDWDVYVPYVLFAYRTSVHEFLQQSPFYCLFGRTAQFPEDIMLRSIADSSINQESQPFLYELKNNLETAYATIDERFDQLELRRSTDNHAANYTPPFKSGDLVMHYIPIKGRTKKLAHKWHGPFIVLDVFNNGMNYKIHRVHSRTYTLLNYAASKVVNASRLKRYYPHSYSSVRSTL